jgi:hypothetical protein
MRHITSAYNLVKLGIIYKKLDGYLMLVNVEEMNDIEIYLK